VLRVMLMERRVLLAKEMQEALAQLADIIYQAVEVVLVVLVEVVQEQQMEVVAPAYLILLLVRL